MNELDRKLLNILQEGLPLHNSPFKVIGTILGVSELEVIEKINELKRLGYIRRLGGVFDSKALGFSSTLCAASAPNDKIEEISKIINSYNEITHNYVRDNYYNLWFTIVGPTKESLYQIQEEIKFKTGIDKIINLPCTKLFKVKVRLDMVGDVSVNASRY